MKTSKVMEELRAIRDEDSLRHFAQTPEEFSKEMRESAEWFIEKLGKPINRIYHAP